MPFSQSQKSCQPKKKAGGQKPVTRSKFVLKMQSSERETRLLPVGFATVRRSHKPFNAPAK